MSESLLRVLTALVGVPVVVGLLYLGGWPFTVLVLVLALAAQLEVYRLLALNDSAFYSVLGIALGGLLVLRVVFPPALFLAVAVVVLAIVVYPLTRQGTQPVAPGHATEERSNSRSTDDPGTLAVMLFGAIYPSTLLAYLVELRQMRGPEVDDTGAFFLTLTVFLLVWSTDTFAYYAGRAFGRRALAPRISPKKTWSGAVAGVVGALGVAVLSKLLFLSFLPWLHVVAVAVICGVVGQLGDLAESKIKRMVGAKDAGTLLPGHGGVLDRFDAMIVVAPSVYLYLRYVAHL